MLGDFLKRTFAAPKVRSREDLGKVLVADASRYVEDPQRMEMLLRTVISIDPKRLAASDKTNQNTIEVIEQARGRWSPNAYWGRYTKHFRACVMKPSSPTQAVIATRQAIKAYLLQNDENYRALYLNQSPRPEVAAARALASEFNSSISSLETSMRTASNFRGSDKDEMESESAQLISSALAVPGNIAAKYSELCNALANVPEDQRRGVNLSRGMVPSNFSYLDSQSGGNNEADVESLVGGVRRAVNELRACKARFVDNVLKPLGIASAEAGNELRELEARQLNRMFTGLGYNPQQITAAMGFLGFKWGEIVESDRRNAAAAAAQEERDLRQQQIQRDRDAEQARRTAEAERIAREAQ